MKKLGRVRAYRRIGLLEDAVSQNARTEKRIEVLETAINQGARQLTDAEVRSMRAK